MDKLKLAVGPYFTPYVLCMSSSSSSRACLIAIVCILNAFPGRFHTNSLFCPLPQAPRLDENTLHHNSFSNSASNKELGVGRWGLTGFALRACDWFCKQKKKIGGNGVGRGEFRTIGNTRLQKGNSRLELLIEYPGIQVSVREDFPTTIKSGQEHVPVGV